ncbi:MAG: hypothetical protein O7G30_13075 [Proteobacteria bacterium]|nr:hypothetical protein [Pseudomonadota bacterium]
MSGDDSASEDGTITRGPALPEFLRRAMALGLTGFFSTEEALRKALGDTLPQDWVDFATQQSDRARAEFIDRLSAEFGRILEEVDLVELAERLLDGRTIEISAQIRLGDREAKPGRRRVHAKVHLEEGGKEKKGKR